MAAKKRKTTAKKRASPRERISSEARKRIGERIAAVFPGTGVFRRNAGNGVIEMQGVRRG